MEGCGVSASFIEGSRENWFSKSNRLNINQINTGALLRIANATEKMCLDREKLERDCKYMRDRRDHYRALYEKECKRSAGLKGHISRLKKIIDHFKVSGDAND